MERVLTKANFWNQAQKEYPTVTEKFCKWIDEYKKSISWILLINNPFKFHNMPVEMQLGIIQRFFWEEYMVRVNFKAYDSIEQIISEMWVVFGYYEDLQKSGRKVGYFTPEYYEDSYKAMWMDNPPKPLIQELKPIYQENPLSDAKFPKPAFPDTTPIKGSPAFSTNQYQGSESRIIDNQISTFLRAMNFEYKPPLGRTVSDYPYGRYEKGKIHKDPNIITVSFLKRQVGRRLQESLTVIPGKMVVILQKKTDRSPRIAKFFTIEQEGGIMQNEQDFNTVEELEKIVFDLIKKYQTKFKEE